MLRRSRTLHLAAALAVKGALPGGYQLGNDVALLWSAFAALHHKHRLPGELEIPMDSLARAVEIVLKKSELRDASNFRTDATMWNVAVRSCGYV